MNGRMWHDWIVGGDFSVFSFEGIWTRMLDVSALSAQEEQQSWWLPVGQWDGIFWSWRKMKEITIDLVLLVEFQLNEEERGWSRVTIRGGSKPILWPHSASRLSSRSGSAVWWACIVLWGNVNHISVIRPEYHIQVVKTAASQAENLWESQVWSRRDLGKTSETTRKGRQLEHDLLDTRFRRETRSILVLAYQ
jgi:hypothetical protein